MKLVHVITIPNQYPVSLEQSTSGRFTVRYGLQVKRGLDYSDAAKEFGLCVFHALACSGELDNEV